MSKRVITPSKWFWPKCHNNMQFKSQQKMECGSSWFIFNDGVIIQNTYLQKIDVQEFIPITKRICVWRSCRIERCNSDGAR